MLYYVSGTVTVLEPGLAVIDCGGVGYGCRVTAYTAAQLKLNQPAKLYITESIREDAFDLFGFISREEQRCYELLTSVTGVGPKAAIAILSAGPQNHQVHTFPNIHPFCRRQVSPAAFFALQRIGQSDVSGLPRSRFLKIPLRCTRHQFLPLQPCSSIDCSDAFRSGRLIPRGHLFHNRSDALLRSSAVRMIIASLRSRSLLYRLSQQRRQR